MSGMRAVADQFAPWAIGVPVVVACVVLAGGGGLPRWSRDVLAVATGVAVCVLDAFLLAVTTGGRVITWAGGWTPHHGVTVGIVLAVDALGAGLALLVAIVVTCALVYSRRYFDDVDGHFHVLFLLFLAGCTGFVLTGDLFDMVVFFELLGVCGFALTAFKIEDEQSVHGGLTMAVVTSLGAYMTLAGSGILYGRTGQLGLAQLSRAVAGHRTDALVLFAFVLVLTGWLVKAAAVPFHFWTADAESVAPIPVCAVFSGVMVELGVYGVGRVYWTAFHPAVSGPAFERAMLVLGVAGAVIGALLCLAQRSLKRLLAYTTIAHVGLFLCGLGADDADGVAGASLYIAGHAGVQAALFLIVGVLSSRLGDVDELALFGRARRGTLGVVMALDGLALAGLPPFGPGLGKAVTEESLTKAGHPWAPVLFVAVSALTGGAVLRAAARIFLGAGERPAIEGSGSTGGDEDASLGGAGGSRRPPLPMTVALGLLSLLGLALGCIPRLAEGAAAAAARFVDTGGYVSAVLGGPAPPPPPVPEAGWTLSGVLLGLLSVLLALAVAAVGLYPRTVAVRLPAVRAARPVLDGLHALHSGHVGDYVAWLITGVAALAALVGMPALL